MYQYQQVGIPKPSRTQHGSKTLHYFLAFGGNVDKVTQTTQTQTPMRAGGIWFALGMSNPLRFSMAKTFSTPTPFCKGKTSLHPSPNHFINKVKNLRNRHVFCLSSFSDYGLTNQCYTVLIMGQKCMHKWNQILYPKDLNPDNFSDHLNKIGALVPDL